MNHATLRRNTRVLPHQVGTADIGNAELKRVAMQFMENFKALNERVAEVETIADNGESEEPEPEPTYVTLSVFLVATEDPLSFSSSRLIDWSLSNIRAVSFIGGEPLDVEDGEEPEGGAIRPYACRVALGVDGTASVMASIAEPVTFDGLAGRYILHGLYSVLSLNSEPDSAYKVSDNPIVTLTLTADTTLYAYYKPYDESQNTPIWANTVGIFGRGLNSYYDYVPVIALLEAEADADQEYNVSVFFQNTGSSLASCRVGLNGHDEAHKQAESNVAARNIWKATITVKKADYIYLNNGGNSMVNIYIRITDNSEAMNTPVNGGGG